VKTILIQLDKKKYFTLYISFWQTFSAWLSLWSNTFLVHLYLKNNIDSLDVNGWTMLVLV